jgi:hypothetical protein
MGDVCIFPPIVELRAIERSSTVAMGLAAPCWPPGVSEPATALAVLVLAGCGSRRGA